MEEVAIIMTEREGRSRRTRSRLNVDEIEGRMEKTRERARELWQRHELLLAQALERRQRLSDVDRAGQGDEAPMNERGDR